jgi:hypothetical protein
MKIRFYLTKTSRQSCNLFCRHIWGLFWLRPNLPLNKVAEELNLIWEVSEAEEWIDKIGWIPF